MLRPRGARCGAARQNAQPGSVTFIQRFGSAINLHLHFHVIVLEGVYLDRTAQGRQPRFVTGEPPTDADIAAVGQKIGCVPLLHEALLGMRLVLSWTESWCHLSLITPDRYPAITYPRASLS